MPSIPFPIEAEDIQELKRKLNEIIRQLFEDKIGGLDLGDVFSNAGDYLTLVTGNSLSKTSGTLDVNLKASGGLATAATGVYVVPGDIKLDDLASPDDNTDLDASTSKHGLLPKFPNGAPAVEYLCEDGNWSAPNAENFYPVTSIFIHTQFDTDPADILGFGTWTYRGSFTIGVTPTYGWERTA